MPISRRGVLASGAGIAIARIMATGVAPAAGNAPDELAASYQDKGYEIAEANGLITGASYNGGLRFDEWPRPAGYARAIWLQPCTRLDDIDRRGKAGVLAHFHIFAFSNEKPDFPGQVLSDTLQFATRNAGLDPARLLLVSTDRIDPFRPLVEESGLGAHQIVIRPWDEAVAAGDGSGYFAPRGHPGSPALPTASLHYRLDGTAGGTMPAYPFDGHLELAELALPTQDSPLEVGAIGTERLAMAQGEPSDSYEQTLLTLVAAMEEEAAARDVPLPEGYHTYRSL